MIREIYCKLPTDQDYEMKVEMLDEAKAILQQIKVVLGTKPGDVLGSPYFGTNLEDYLFKLNYNKEEMIQMINYEIYNNVRYNQNKWSIGVDIYFGHDANDPYEYAVIDISLNQKRCLGIVVNQQ